MYDPREFCCPKCFVPVETKYAECGPGGPIDYGKCPECGIYFYDWAECVLIDPIEAEYARHEAAVLEKEAKREEAEFKFFLEHHCDMRCLDYERGCRFEMCCEKYEKTFDR